jgi:hypothetical protein
MMGIRAVQAGALTDALNRTLPEMLDYLRAASFRALAREIGESPTALRWQYKASPFASISEKDLRTR